MANGMKKTACGRCKFSFNYTKIVLVKNLIVNVLQYHLNGTLIKLIAALLIILSSHTETFLLFSNRKRKTIFNPTLVYSTIQ